VVEGGSGFGWNASSPASVSSAGTTASSAGQLLNVTTGATGSRASLLRRAANAHDAAPRRSTTHSVLAGRPPRATFTAASPACATTSRLRASGKVALAPIGSTDAMSVPFT
jgi:hypothetical protein